MHFPGTPRIQDNAGNKQPAKLICALVMINAELTGNRRTICIGCRQLDM